MKNEFLPRLKNILLLPVLFLLFTAMSIVGQAQTVHLDQDDLHNAPGETVQIGGTDIVLGELITLKVNHLCATLPGTRNTQHGTRNTSPHSEPIDL